MEAKQHATKEPMSDCRNQRGKKIFKCLETNDKENRIFQNLWISAKAVLRGKFIAINVSNKQRERSQTT